MTCLARLLLATCVLAAPLHAASIPDLQKKIPAALPDDIKELPTDREVIVPEPAKEINNELRAKPEDIPVEVVVGNAEPSVKLNEVDDVEIKRPAVDLRNPGPPQRQEHETQNPELHSDELLKVSAIKENIERTQHLLRESFQDVSDNIQNWFYRNDDENKIHKNILNLRETFTGQIQKLNDTIQALVQPAASESESQEESQRSYEQIQSSLKLLKDKFNNDVESLSAGVELVGSLRSSADEAVVVKEETTAKPAEPSATTAPPNVIVQMVTGIRDQMTAALTNIQNMLPGATPAPPPGTQADVPATDPSIGSSGLLNTLQELWINRPQYLSTVFSSFANITQNLPKPFQNLPWNPLNPTGSSTAIVKPTEATSSLAADKPADSPAAAADKPADVVAPVPVPAPAAQAATAAPAPPGAGGPVRQFLSNIPVVQYIQNSITNRDTPREPAQKGDTQTKGGWYGPPGRPGGSGDNNDSGVSEKNSEKIEEPIKEEPLKVDSIKEESIKEESIKKEAIKEDTIKEPIKEESIKEEPIKEESIKEEPIKEESIKEESKKEVTQVRPEAIPEKTDKS